MTDATIRDFAAVILVSTEPEGLAHFYRETLGLPVEAEQHGETLPHWGCTLGNQHFAIHRPDDFPDGRWGVGSVELAFDVVDLDAILARVRSRGRELLSGPRDDGFMKAASLLDPDGNLVELVQMSDAWCEHLAARPAGQRSALSQWVAERTEGAA